LVEVIPYFVSIYILPHAFCNINFPSTLRQDLQLTLSPLKYVYTSTNIKITWQLSSILKSLWIV